MTTYGESRTFGNTRYVRRILARSVTSAARVPWLSVVGLAMLAASAFTIALPLGLLASGICALVLEWRIGE